MTGYRELPAPPALCAEAECSWRAELPATAAARPTRVLPDGCMDLLWLDGQVVVAGPDTTAHITLHRPGTTITGLRLRPGVAPALLGLPASALRDQRVALTDIRAPAAERTSALVAAGATPLAALTALAGELRAAGPGTDPALRVAADLLRRGASVAATADTLGWSVRSVHRRCESGFGYGPAVLRRILRFRSAMALVHRGVPTAEAAACAGYADQPHLSREVRALAGAPLGRLLGQVPAGSAANRSTPLPSGSRTTA